MSKSLIRELKSTFAPPVTLEQVPVIAERILSELGVSTLPIPIVDIMKQFGFRIFIKRFDDLTLSGLIAIDAELEHTLGSDKVICVSKSDTPGRRRFTVAHEFAHYLFDFDDNSAIKFYDAYKTDQSDNNAEIIASRFAAELLMPQAIFQQEYEKLKDYSLFEKVASLSKTFAVPPKSVQIRIERELASQLVG